MSQFLVLSHVDVQNANSIAGLTWGFPAITHFLGFTHALSRKVSKQYLGSYDTELIGCVVVSNNTHNKVYQPKEFAPFEFLQSKNPPILAKHKVGSPPIVEEGKMNLTVSLVIELSNSLTLTTDGIRAFEKYVGELCNTMRLAGGAVLNIKSIKLLSANTEEQQKNLLRNIKRLTMPGFVLLDRSDYLKEYQLKLQAKHETLDSQSQPQLIDAWLDFSALRYKAEPQLAKDQVEPDENTSAEWKYVAKPKSGYLVPLMTGYKAISEIYEAGAVENTRDSTTRTRFVEAVHSVGEWKGMHSVKYITDIIWRYQQAGEWYLCVQQAHERLDENEDKTLEESTQLFSSEETNNLF